jgi:type I restriction enzyme S subunit
MSEYPSDWETANLKDITEIKASNIDKKTMTGEKPVRICNYTDVTSNRLITREIPFLRSSASAAQVRTFSLLRDDILITKDAEVGNVSIVLDDIDNLVCGYHLYQLRTARKEVLPKYLFWALQSDWAQSHFRKEKTGTTIAGLARPALEALSIPLPPLAEQKKIAEILSEIDRRYSKLKDRINALSRVRIQLVREFLKQGIRKETDHTNGLPQGWEERTLGEVSEFRRGSFPQPYGNPEWFDDAGFPFVQVYDIDDNGKLKPNTKTRISQAAADKSVYIPSGSLIVSLQGSIGRVAITQYDAYVDRTILIFTGYENILSREYFSLLVGDLFSRKSEVADGGVIKTITKQTLKEFFVRIPPLDEQRKLSTIVSNLDLTISLYKEQLLKGGLLMKSLADDLLSGRKRVSV